MDQFKDIAYLKNGSEVQQRAYATLVDLGILEALGGFRARLVGTIPLDISVSSSDLDILCSAKYLDHFESQVTEFFQNMKDFQLSRKEIDGQISLIARFDSETFPIEIFAQETPVDEQKGWLHMLAEHRYLLEKGEGLRKEVIRLKKKGVKTEPAFAKALDLNGDPFEELIRINLETKRCRIRSIRKEDSTELFHYRQNKEVNKYQGWLPESLEEMTRLVEEQCYPYVPVEGKWHQVVVRSKDSNKVIGDMALHFTGEGAHIVELGIAFDSDFHGQGFATEAMSELLEYIFDHHQREKAQAIIDPRNIASIKLFERLGFQKEAHLKEATLLRGELVDDVYFGLLRNDFVASRTNHQTPA